jgi:hypothetical protein
MPAKQLEETYDKPTRAPSDRDLMVRYHMALQAIIEVSSTASDDERALSMKAVAKVALDMYKGG